MILKCIYNNYNGLALNNELKQYESNIRCGSFHENLPISINKYYVCHAIAFAPFTERLYIEDESGSIYPKSYPSILFSYVDKSVSKYWTVGEKRDYRNNIWPILAFKEWASDIYFSGSIFEGNKESLRIFEKYKYLMEVELPRPDITETAEPLGEDYWVFDSLSGESWQANPSDALLRVPNINRLINNPHYKKLGSDL